MPLSCWNVCPFIVKLLKYVKLLVFINLYLLICHKDSNLRHDMMTLHETHLKYHVRVGKYGFGSI